MQRKVRACVGCNQRTKHKVCPEGPTGSMNIGWGVLTKDLGVRAGSVLPLRRLRNDGNRVWEGWGPGSDLCGS